jgi:AcrR family transcriptional regulator
VSTAGATIRTRHSAAERREAVLEAAMAEFAVGGLRGTSTDAIAARAGISQPYLFKLFGTKKDLFVATVELGFRRTREAFAQALVGVGEADVFEAMGQAYLRLVTDRTMLLGQIQAYAACEDPDVRAAVRREFGDLWKWVQRVSGRSDEEVRQFFAIGMLVNVQAAIDLQGVDEPWAMSCLGPCGQ